MTTLHVGRSDASYETAERAAKEYVDCRTRDQRHFDEFASSVDKLLSKIRTLTATPWRGERTDPYGYYHAAGREAPFAPNRISIIADLVSDLNREMRQLSIIGYREGSAAPGMPELKPIEKRPVGFKADRVVDLNGDQAA